MCVACYFLGPEGWGCCLLWLAQALHFGQPRDHLQHFQATCRNTRRTDCLNKLTTTAVYCLADILAKISLQTPATEAFAPPAAKPNLSTT